jgi:hypothetical protein
MTEFYSMEMIDISKSNQYDIKKKTKKTNQTKDTKINTGENVLESHDWVLLPGND